MTDTNTTRNDPRTDGRLPAFAGLAGRTGGLYTEGARDVAAAVRQVGLDAEISLQPTYAEITELGDDGVTTRRIELPHLRTTVATYRDGRVVGYNTVSPRYGIVQTADALSFGQNIVDGGDGSLFALGAHGNPVGAKVYAAFKLAEGMTVGGGDPHDLYLTITTSHDGTGGLTALLAPIRLACTNQTYAIFGKKGGNPRFTIRHTSGAKLRAAEARHALDLAFAYRDTFVAEAEGLLAQKQSKDNFVVFAREVFGQKDDTKMTDRSRTMAANREERLLEILASQTNEFGRGTAYAGYNAVVEYVDHFSIVRGADPEASRQERIVNGQLDRIKQRAWNLAAA